MYTYQDLDEIRGDEEKTMQFVLDCIYDFKTSDEYKTAQDYRDYARGENPTLRRSEKVIYDMLGNAHRDNISPNHKIYSRYVYLAITEGTQYLLGNGISFDNGTAKEQLGDDIDERLSEWADDAQTYGVSYGFWNGEKLQIFPYLQCIPLLDEYDSTIKALIRFWQLDDDKPMHIVLYEVDGMTDYIQEPGEKIRVKNAKRGYPKIKTNYGLDAIEDEITEFYNFPALPVIPLYYINHKSILWGNTPAVDAYDLLNSRMVNNIDEGNLVYWVLRNCNGMDEIDLQNFIARLHKSRVLPVDGDEGADAVPHQVEAPVNSTELGIERIKALLDENFMTANAESIRAGNVTATQIKAAYHRLDMKTARFEYQVIKAVKRLLFIIGIPDEKFTFTWSRELNKSEEIQSILQVAQFLDEETVTRMLLEAMGKIDIVEDVLSRKQEDSLKQYNLVPQENALKEAE